MTPRYPLSVVIPVFNEEERLPASLERILAWKGDLCSISEVIVVDDGSQDATLAIAKRFTDERLRTVTYHPNAGKGYAIRRGVLESTADVILLCDADLSTPIEEADALARHLADFEIVIGSRAIDVSTVTRKQPWYRQQMGRTFNTIMRMITGLPYRDTQCGFKLMTRDAGRAIFTEAVIDRFAFDVEMLIIAHHLGLHVKEAPVTWLNSEDSRVRIVRDSSRMLLDIIRTRLRLGRTQ